MPNNPFLSLSIECFFNNAIPRKYARQLQICEGPMKLVSKIIIATDFLYPINQFSFSSLTLSLSSKWRIVTAGVSNWRAYFAVCTLIVYLNRGTGTPP